MSYDEEQSIVAMHRILRKAGTERVSDSACEELAGALDELGVKIGRYTLTFAMYAVGKTIKGRDVKIEAKKLMSH